MKNLAKEKPELQPNPETNPIRPRSPEISPETERTRTSPVLPEIKPSIKPEIG